MKKSKDLITFDKSGKLINYALPKYDRRQPLWQYIGGNFVLIPMFAAMVKILGVKRTAKIMEWKILS